MIPMPQIQGLQHITAAMLTMTGRSDLRLPRLIVATCDLRWVDVGVQCSCGKEEGAKRLKNISKWVEMQE